MCSPLLTSPQKINSLPYPPSRPERQRRERRSRIGAERLEATREGQGRAATREKKNSLPPRRGKGHQEEGRPPGKAWRSSLDPTA